MMHAKAWRLTLAAAALMALVVGTRSAFGLFVSPLNTATGAGLASLSLALALGQLAVGFTQPLVGAWSDRFGAACVIVVGAIVLAVATVLPAAWPQAGLALPALVAGAVAASAVASNGLLVGEINRNVAAASPASGSAAGRRRPPAPTRCRGPSTSCSRWVRPRWSGRARQAARCALRRPGPDRARVLARSSDDGVRRPADPELPFGHRDLAVDFARAGRFDGVAITPVRRPDHRRSTMHIHHGTTGLGTTRRDGCGDRHATGRLPAAMSRADAAAGV